MAQVTTAQIKKIHAILPMEIKRDREMKKSLIIQFTGDQDKTSTKDLTKSQAKLLIEKLNGNPSPAPKRKSWSSFDKNNQQHKYILSLCHQIGWVKYHHQQKRMVADLDQLSGWLKKYGYLKKPLMDYNNQELPTLINQLEKVLTTEYKK